MSFKFKIFQICVIWFAFFIATSVNAAEWKTEPSLYLRAEYNDNIRMRAENNNPESSTGYSLSPRVKFSGEEQRLWDMAIDARGKITRYQDIEDADSENAFFVFDGGRQTERTVWRLSTSFERNSTFDTDFDTETPDAGLLDDHTERKTASVSPSVRWYMSESSVIIFSLESLDVKYDEVTNLNYQDYDYDSAKFVAYWQLTENQQIGFTSSYSEYDSPNANFSYNQAVIQFDYVYSINQVSNLSFSLGGRRLDSLLVDGQLVGCNFPGEYEAFGSCPFSNDPILADLENEDDGTVVNFSYTSKTETTVHAFTAGRTVIPSSFGGAQEQRNATYKLNVRNTERLTMYLILDASDRETINGVNSTGDRTRYRIEPSVTYKLDRNWDLDFVYRYIDQNITDSNIDSSSNAIFINLKLHWPKLATTY